MRSFLSLVFLLPLAVSAAPLSDPLSCNVDPVVLASLQQDDAVVSYCSRYLLIDATTITESATETPYDVTMTIPVTTVGDATTTTETSTETITIDEPTTQITTETAYETTTVVTTTATLYCLDAAYTASAPTVENPPVETLVPDFLAPREVDTTCSHSTTAKPKPTTTIVVYATTTVCPCTETSSKAPCTESSLHGSAGYATSTSLHGSAGHATSTSLHGSAGHATSITSSYGSAASSTVSSITHGPFTSSNSYSVPHNSTIAPSGSLYSSGASSYAPSGSLYSSGVSSYAPSTSSYVSSTSWDVASACSCLTIPTPSVTEVVTTTLEAATITELSTETSTPTITEFTTITETSTNTITEMSTEYSTSTQTAYATATTIASNGIAYRKYSHNFNANLENSGFTSTYFKNRIPDYSSVLQSLTFSTPNWPSGSLYLTLADGASFDASQVALVFQGFFIAQQTGTYTLSSAESSIDNWGYLWTGDSAYSQWDESNAAFMASRTGDGNYGGFTEMNLNAGDAVPLAWLWANGGGVAQSYFAITAPDGTYTTDTTGYFVQSCSAGTFA